MLLWIADKDSFCLSLFGTYTVECACVAGLYTILLRDSWCVRGSRGIIRITAALSSYRAAAGMFALVHH